MRRLGKVISFPLRDVADNIVAGGAIMTVPGTPLVRQLVGDVRWVGDGRLLWLVAFGDTVADGHVLDYDHIDVHPVGVCFCLRGIIKGFIAPIEKSAVNDPDDYLIAWQLWQEVVPTKRKFIDAVFSALDSAAGPSMLVDGIPIGYPPAVNWQPFRFPSRPGGAEAPNT